MRKLVLISLLCFISSFSFAQKKKSYNTRSVFPGIRGGYNVTNLSNSRGYNKSDFYIGLQVPVKVSEYYEIQPELNYFKQGARKAIPVEYFDDYGFTGQRGYEDLDISYVEADLINKIHFGLLHLQIGPGLAVITENHPWVKNKVDVTLNIGLGLELTKNFGIEARFKHGLIPVTEAGNNNYHGYNNDYYSDTQLNQSFQIGAYLKF